MSRVTLKSRLPEVSAEIRPRVGRAVKSTAQDIEADAKERAPVLTGALRDSLITERAGAASYRVGSPLYYSRFVELGTVHAAAEPFLIPAAEAHTEEAVARVEIVLREL